MIGDRISAIQIGNLLSTRGPTQTHRRSYEIAVRELGPVRKALEVLTRQAIPELEAKFETAGVAWSPGRAVPKPN